MKGRCGFWSLSFGWRFLGLSLPLCHSSGRNNKWQAMWRDRLLGDGGMEMLPWSAIIRSRITNVLSYIVWRHCRYLEIAASDGTVLCIIVWFPHLFKGFQTSPMRLSIFNFKTAKCRKFRPLRKYLCLQPATSLGTLNELHTLVGKICIVCPGTRSSSDNLKLEGFVFFFEVGACTFRAPQNDPSIVSTKGKILYSNGSKNKSYR